MALTEQGKRLLPFAAITLALGLGLQIRDQSKAEKATKDGAVASGKAEQLGKDLTKANEKIDGIYTMVSRTFADSPILQKEAVQNDRVFAQLTSIVSSAKTAEPQLDDA